MKRFTFIAAGFLFAAAFASTAFGQVPAAPVGKIGLVNTGVFGDAKAGITKVRTALTSLDTEFKPASDEIRTLYTRYNTLRTEVENSQKAAAAAAGTVPVNTAGLDVKFDELKKLETSIKRKEEDAKANYERRYQIVVGPLMNEILRAMNDFAKQKGYAVILDGAKLMEAGLLMGYDDRYDVTKDFVTFYNTRPAGTATAAAPK